MNTKVQISFSKDADLKEVRKQLLGLIENDYDFYSCFLPRHIVIKEGFSTDIVDLLDEVLGDRHTYIGNEHKTLGEFVDQLHTMRVVTGNIVSKLFVLGTDIADGVKAEINEFTNYSVIIA